MTDSDLIIEGLKKNIAARRVVAIVGAGVSMGATKGAAVASWDGLLKDGVQRCVSVDAANSNWARMMNEQLLADDLDCWLSVAEQVTAKLGRKGGEYSSWLRETMGALTVEDAAVIKAIQALNIPILTTNYDNLIEEVTGYKPVVWQDEHKVSRILRGEDNGIIHLHGHYDVPDSVVLGIRSYEEIAGDAYTQTVLRALAAVESFLFIGCGAGLRDPNFGELLKWSAQFLKNVEHRNVRLVSDREYEALEKQHADAERIWVRPYGDHCDLADYLESLKPDPSTTTEMPRAEDVPHQYLDWLKNDVADVDLLGLKLQSGHAIKINNVYVPLTVPVKVDRKKGEDKNEPEKTDGEDSNRPSFESLLRVADRGSVYISGVAGSGKSTFCRWMAWLACEGQLPEFDPNPPESHAEEFPSSFYGRLPILLRLRDFWRFLPQDPESQDLGEQEFRDSIHRWIDSKRHGGLTWEIIKSHLDNGTLLIILDGVDEVPISRPNGSLPRALLMSGMATAAKAWTEKGNRLILTSRPYGVSENDQRKIGLPHVGINDLDDTLERLLVCRWFGCLSDSDDESEATANKMLSNISEREDIRALRQNPMLVTAICIVYHQGQRLPEGRWELYDRIVDNVLFNRFPDPKKVAQVRNHLAVVAFGMHTGEWLDEEREIPQAEASNDELDRIIGLYRDNTNWQDKEFEDRIATREELLTRTGILLPRDKGRAGFYHYTFQDFLAAETLLDNTDNLVEFFRQRGNSPEWKSTLAFAFGSHMAKYSSPRRSTELLCALIDDLGKDEIRLGILIGECIRILAQKAELPDKQLKRFQDFSVKIVEGKIDCEMDRRIELGITLGYIGDPRIHSLHDPAAWMRIEAGDYDIGGGDVVKIEEPFTTTRYPVTTSQFLELVDDGLYEKDEWWSVTGLQWRINKNLQQIIQYHNTKENNENAAQTNINFHESNALASANDAALPSVQQAKVILSRGVQMQTSGIRYRRELGTTREAVVGLIGSGTVDPTLVGYGIEIWTSQVMELQVKASICVSLIQKSQRVPAILSENIVSIAGAAKYRGCYLCRVPDE